MSSDREHLIELLGRAYSILLAYGVQNSSNMDRVLLPDPASNVPGQMGLEL